MGRLCERQIQQISDALGALYERATPATLPWNLLQATERLIPSHFYQVDIIRADSQVVDCYGVGPKLTAAELQLFNAHVPEHPSLLPLMRAIESRPFALGRWSDYTTLHDFRKTTLHHEFFRTFGCNHQLGMAMRTGAAETVGISFNRQKGEFTDGERDALEVMAPHFQNVHAQVSARARLERMLSLGRTFAQSGASMAVDHPSGEIHFATSEARRLCAFYLGVSEAAAFVPPALQSWLLRPHSGPTFSVPHEYGWVEVRRTPVTGPGPCAPFSLSRLPGAEPGAWLLDFAERQAAPAVTLLRKLGLTEREAEVLHWMAEGKRNTEIATLLRVQPRTVEKHCENLLAKLQVETRTAAVAEAWRLLVTASSR